MTEQTNNGGSQMTGESPSQLDSSAWVGALARELRAEMTAMEYHGPNGTTVDNTAAYTTVRAIVNAIERTIESAPTAELCRRETDGGLNAGKGNDGKP